MQLFPDKRVELLLLTFISAQAAFSRSHVAVRLWSVSRTLPYGMGPLYSSGPGALRRLLRKVEQYHGTDCFREALNQSPPSVSGARSWSRVCKRAMDTSIGRAGDGWRARPAPGTFTAIAVAAGVSTSTRVARTPMRTIAETPCSATAANAPQNAKTWGPATR